MWGNFKGWVIAGVLVLLMTLTTYFAAGVNQKSTPTSWGKDAKRLAPLELKIDPSTVVPMTQSPDAGLYASAITDAKRNANRYEAFMESTDVEEGQKLPAVRDALKAAPMSPTPLLAGDPKANIGYFPDNTSDDLKALETLGNALGRIAALLNLQKKTDATKSYYEAQFALGAKMYKERLVFSEAFAGIGFMRQAIKGLVPLADAAKETERAKQLREFDAALAETYASMDKTWKVLYGIDNATNARHAGDYYYLATDAMKEKMWRVEAILKVGRLRFNAGGASARLADQANVTPFLSELQRDKDPAIAAAADAALNLTLDDFRKIQ